MPKPKKVVRAEGSYDSESTNYGMASEVQFFPSRLLDRTMQMQPRRQVSLLNYPFLALRGDDD